jgi:hypothetical protein
LRSTTTDLASVRQTERDNISQKRIHIDLAINVFEKLDRFEAWLEWIVAVHWGDRRGRRRGMKFNLIFYFKFFFFLKK